MNLKLFVSKSNIIIFIRLILYIIIANIFRLIPYVFTLTKLFTTKYNFIINLMI